MNKDEYYHISHEGLLRLSQNINENDPVQNLLWTNDYTLELPIRMSQNGPGSIQPKTLIEVFQKTVQKYPQYSAMSVKRNKIWQTTNYTQYYDQCCSFAKACLSLDLKPYCSVNIIGFNSPEWMISYYGSMMGFYLPVGIYTTNTPDACHYITSHSDAELVVVEDRQQLNKYLKIWENLPLLKAVVVYNDENIPNDFVPSQYRSKVLQWKQFMEMGKKYTAKSQENSLENRIERQKPGNVCTLVYTSGTTGQPKGVMLSHDNFTWTAETTFSNSEFALKAGDRIISYLPLSHVAGQFLDVIGSVHAGAHVFFAAPDALAGSLVETLKEVRPNFFFSVPRVWEKMEEKMKQTAAQKGTMAKSIGTWAKGMGSKGTFAEFYGQQTPFFFGLAKSLVYNNVKEALGLDQARYLIFGAAPLSADSREYFLSLNILLTNGFGMSETSSAGTLSSVSKFAKFDQNYMSSCGSPLPGIQLKIHNPDAEGNGEILLRGRNIFKGYYKNEEASRETLDKDGYLHTGDVGKVDNNGNMSITGRIKELLITAGGENVAPVLIEQEIKKQIPFLSNVMVVGDKLKFLSAILTLKYDLDKNGKLTEKLSQDVLNELKAIGSTSTTYDECVNDKKFQERIESSIQQANSKAISQAQYVRKWVIIRGDFTTDGGELTPTLKLKRKVATQKNQGSIDQMYVAAKL